MCPIARSGHTAVVHDNKMFIFGGMVELTKELNDLAIFDINLKKNSSRQTPNHLVKKQLNNPKKKLAPQ